MTGLVGVLVSELAMDVGGAAAGSGAAWAVFSVCFRVVVAAGIFGIVTSEAGWVGSGVGGSAAAVVLAEVVAWEAARVDGWLADSVA